MAAGVTAEKIGWNVVGLDSNRVDIGPNRFPNGTRICNTSGGEVSGPATLASGIEVVKSSSSSYVTAVGESVPFSFVVTNTGQATLTGVTVLAGALDSPAVCPSPATLNPGDSFTCTGSGTRVGFRANRGFLGTVGGVRLGESCRPLRGFCGQVVA